MTYSSSDLGNYRYYTNCATTSEERTAEQEPRLNMNINMDEVIKRLKKNLMVEKAKESRSIKVEQFMFDPKELNL